MPPKKRASHSWVYAIWGLNAVVVICLLGGGIFYLNSQRASAANDPAGTVSVSLRWAMTVTGLRTWCAIPLTTSRSH